MPNTVSVPKVPVHDFGLRKFYYVKNTVLRIRNVYPGSGLQGQKDHGSGSASKNSSILTLKIASKLSEIWSGLFIPDPRWVSTNFDDCLGVNFCLSSFFRRPLLSRACIGLHFTPRSTERNDPAVTWAAAWRGGGAGPELHPPLQDGLQGPAEQDCPSPPGSSYFACPHIRHISAGLQALDTILVVIVTGIRLNLNKTVEDFFYF